jgi:hypothetical protein
MTSARSEVTSVSPRPSVLHAWWTPFLIVQGCVLLLIITLIANWHDIDGPSGGHRRTPAPPGLVFQLEARVVNTPWDCIRVFPLAREGPAVAVVDAGSRPNSATVQIYRYPSGLLVERLEGERAADLIAELAADAQPNSVLFDFDGDGILDRLEVRDRGIFGHMRVLSGHDSSVLFEDQDTLEYECDERAFALGDLDGDGFGELALVHPRMDRSTYDLELWDMLLGAKSWISIVSGSRVAR